LVRPPKGGISSRSLFSALTGVSSRLAQTDRVVIVIMTTTMIVMMGAFIITTPTTAAATTIPNEDDGKQHWSTECNTVSRIRKKSSCCVTGIRKKSSCCSMLRWNVSLWSLHCGIDWRQQRGPKTKALWGSSHSPLGLPEHSTLPHLDLWEVRRRRASQPPKWIYQHTKQKIRQSVGSVINAHALLG